MSDPRLELNLAKHLEDIRQNHEKLREKKGYQPNEEIDRKIDLASADIEKVSSFPWIIQHIALIQSKAEKIDSDLRSLDQAIQDIEMSLTVAVVVMTHKNIR